MHWNSSFCSITCHITTFIVRAVFIGDIIFIRATFVMGLSKGYSCKSNGFFFGLQSFITLIRLILISEEDIFTFYIFNIFFFGLKEIYWYFMSPIKSGMFVFGYIYGVYTIIKANCNWSVEWSIFVLHLTKINILRYNFKCKGAKAMPLRKKSNSIIYTQYKKFRVCLYAYPSEHLHHPRFGEIFSL